MSEQPKTKSWWETIPGVVTALATAITAIAGLILALHQAGLIGTESNELVRDIAIEELDTGKTYKDNLSSVEKEGEGPDIREEASDVTPSLHPITISLPNKLKVGPAIYQFSSAKTEDYSDNKMLFRFFVRVINVDNGLGYTLSGDNFRVLLDDIPIAPNEYPIHHIPKQDTKEGEVTFLLPKDVSSIKLQVGRINYSSEGKRIIDINLL